jgi:hypothetical protein
MIFPLYHCFCAELNPSCENANTSSLFLFFSMVLTKMLNTRIIVKPWNHLRLSSQPAVLSAPTRCNVVYHIKCSQTPFHECICNSSQATSLISQPPRTFPCHEVIFHKKGSSPRPQSAALLSRSPQPLLSVNPGAALLLPAPEAFICISCFWSSFW